MITEQGKYLLFSAQSEAVAANLAIYENIARSKSEVVRTATSEVINPSAINIGDLVAMIYTIPGYKQGSLQLSKGYTTSYATIHECANSDGYVIPKPVDALMAGVIYDSIEDYKAEWYQDEIV